ncbi:uncharacterized protein LY89DRAFT_310345 [Mollisia scopiformis]|uniref:Uncharacterized protein n=1 Tax=Mollisia scopiformis TaxID=149040 RepID=A0A194XSR1_MOLSC|nr:uncharacterized protein LY89DRAFT_310345 [Mollisia scopiformis]KUJ22767.1 hypothetical protein LY89DRAFT_310345 [Mollisia scopiformis]
MPKALAIGSRKKRLSLLSSKPSILKNARDSFEWGINELTAPRLKKSEKPQRKARFSMYSGNTTPEEMPPTPPPKSPRRKKKSFATGEHPLKSPYPFAGKEEDDTIMSPSENRFGSKISGAIKSLSTGGRRGSLTNNNNKIVITNKARKNSGPDTPVVGKSSFVETINRGNEQLQGIIEKTRKSVLRTAEEKRRDELKKKIVVVGIGDQSPDGRVSEWL